MTAPVATGTAAALWTPAGFIADEWLVGTSDAEHAASRPRLLSLAEFQTLAETGGDAADNRLGIRLLPAEPLDAILLHLGRLALVDLVFPAFNDGRSYSKASLLRTRHGYRGRLRASGDVLIDQIPLMVRTGFDEFLVTHQPTIKRLSEAAPTGIPYHYQPAADAGAPVNTYSWRRLERRD